MNSETFEQPLDLTCSKTPISKETLNQESPSSSQLDISSVSNEFNYVYVYPGLYPPSSGVMTNDDIEGEAPQRHVSPVPELLSPGKLPSPDSLARAQFVTLPDAMDTGYATTQSLREYSNNAGQQHTPQASTLAQLTPQSIKHEPGEIAYTPPQRQNQQFRPGPKPRQMAPVNKGGKKDHKKCTEMKVISENTTAGVYTSVMKLPWSRRTRTKKPKHKVKLEDTLIPQFMLEQGNSCTEVANWNGSQGSEQNATVVRTPECSESVMMVYPSGGTSAYGKPVRKRGRPPKLPMLAKLLQNQQTGKKSKQEKHVEDMQAQITQQVQANGGMVVYNAGGQIMTAFGGVPVQQTPAAPLNTVGQDVHTPVVPTMTQIPVAHNMVPGMPNVSSTPVMPNITPTSVIPNMAQAQLIGQIPLSQLTGGPIQFLGQFPAHALPFPGQLLQAVPTATSDGQILQQHQTEFQEPNVLIDGTKDEESQSPPQSESVPQVNYQYAFQPMFIPAGALPVPVQASDSVPAAQNDVTQVIKEEFPHTSDTCGFNESAGLSSVNMSGASTHVMKLDGSNTISTMSTTSISNTGSGAIYQEMILSSKSLVDVKKRRRQTAIQMLKAKSGDQNFLCTSFRIRPRLVAQAQAQKERQAAKGIKEECIDEDMEYPDPKNLISPQSDTGHFGENINDGACDVDFSNMQIKQEVNSDDELYDKVKEFDSKRVEQGTETIANVGTVVKNENPTFKRYMLKGSQKRKAKFYGSRIINDSTDTTAHDQNASAQQTSDMGSSDLFQELFNCKVCNTIISVDDMEAHSLTHMNKNYQCHKCGLSYNEGQVGGDESPKCGNCNEVLIKVENVTDSNEANIACDECPDTFKSLPEFYEHKTMHKNGQTSQGGFECDFCGKLYQYYHALQFHRRTHRERKVPCLDKACDVKFRSRKEMELHFDAKHPEKKEYFHCVYEGCTKKFLKNFHLQEHIRVKHYNIKAFQCPWPGCMKEFAAQRHLKIHLLIHRDEKPMKCDHCDYRCRQRSAMNWHMRKHPDVPYKYKRATKSPSVSKSESE